MNDKPGSQATPPLGPDAIRNSLTGVIAISRELEAFTWSPKSDKIYNVEVPRQAIGLHRELVSGGRDFDPDDPIYLIAVSCNTIISTDSVLRIYEELMLITNQPLVGGWVSETGKRLLDGVLSAQFINEDEAIRMAKKYEQDYIVRIDPDGRHRYINTR